MFDNKSTTRRSRWSLLGKSRKSKQYERRRFKFESLEIRRLLACDMSMHMTGDFDLDGDVDGSDFLSLQRSVQVSSPSEVQIDQIQWDLNYGTTQTGVQPQPSHGNHQDEMQAAMALVPLDQATNTVIASGNWSDPNVWQDGVLPNEGARIVIPQGLNLTVDSMVPQEFASVRVDGVLQFATDVDTQLRVDTLVSSSSGCLFVGTAENPIQSGKTASIIIVDRGEIDRVADPTALGRGLILMGTTIIHGAEKNASTTAAIAPKTGDTTLTLTESPDGWLVGDSLAIAGTKLDATGDEVATITAIDGNTVTLAQPLSEDHIPPADDLRVHIANTTRNTYIQSESTQVARRGHVMFMHNPHTDVSYAGFYDLGRTDKSVAPDPAELEDGRLVEGTGTNVAGRYSVHFHRHGVKPHSPAASIVGSALVGSPGWGYVNHSSNVNIIDNVSYDVFGAAFYTEAGDEIGSFVNNLSIKTHGTRLPPNEFEGDDFGHSGDGFWFQGGSGVTIRDNVASGATGSGLIIYGVEFPVDDDVSNIPYLAENLPDPSLANGASTIPVGHTWLTEVSGNTAYGSATGFQMYYHRSPISTDFEGMAEQFIQYQWDFPNSVIEDTTVWSSNIGIRAKYNVDVHYKNVRILNAPNQIGETGFDVSNVYNMGEHIYENVDIRGFETGITPSPNGIVTIDGGKFANQTDINLIYPRQDHRRLDIRGDIQFLDVPGNSELAADRQNIVASDDTRILVDSSERWFLYYDEITLNYGEFTGQQLFHAGQTANFIPFQEQPEQVTPDDPGDDIPVEYVGITNAQMQQLYGASLGGVLATADAVDAPSDGIAGIIGSPSGPPTTLITKLLLGSDLDIDQILNGGDASGG